VKQLATLAAGLMAMSLAHANTAVLVDFETPTSFAFIEEHYNGGTDSASLGGANLGVSFTADAMGLQNDVLGPYFSNAPSPLGVMAPVVGTNATMNVAAGFVGKVGFWYSSDSFVVQGVNVYSGLNGSGSLLASFNLVANAQAGCSSSPYCRFDQMTSSFAGTAKSITFGNASNVAAFDNISITAVPEPTTVLMMTLGLAALALARRRG
jgi:PEP-CTERM motif